MQLAFILLAHDHPGNVIRLMRQLVREGDYVAVHWDKKASDDLCKLATKDLTSTELSRIRFSERINADWGRWSMVEATLAALTEIPRFEEEPEYVILVSGADYPTRPLAELKQFLHENRGMEFIESADPNTELWVIEGLVKERYLHHHWFSWRDSPKLFDLAWRLQRAVGYERKVPGGLSPRFGSQWWGLTWHSLRKIMKFSEDQRIRRFFKTTWIPDEMFFQTALSAVCDQKKIYNRSLTFYHFTAQGRPIVFYDDHLDFILQQDFFFARKLSPHAVELRDRLDAEVAQTGRPPTVRELRKRLAKYEYHSLHAQHGRRNTRVIGRQEDWWYGDLERNQRPYFVIVAPQDIDTESLRLRLNKIRHVKCFGAVFSTAAIEYDLPGMETPLYPRNKQALRDQKRPNFLFDLIRLHEDSLVGFQLHFPSDFLHEMPEISIYDDNANILVVLPAAEVYEEAWEFGKTKHAVDTSQLSNFIYKLRASGKTPILLRSVAGTIQSGDLELAETHISQLVARSRESERRTLRWGYV